MNVTEYLFDKFKERMLKVLRDALEGGEYAPYDTVSLQIENAVVSDEVKQLGGELQEGEWVPPAGSTLDTIYENRHSVEDYYYLLSLKDGRKFFIRLGVSALEIVDKLSDDALESAFWNVMAVADSVFRDMSKSSSK
jgi:hypothetical protein